MSRGDHSALVRRARATRGRVPHHPRGLSRWSGYSETTRVDKFQTSPLTSRLSETSTGAGLSRHDDVERTSLMLAIVATMRGLDICDVSHHRCASVGFGWHRRDDLSIPRCVDHQNGPWRGPEWVLTTKLLVRAWHTARTNHSTGAVAMARRTSALGALGVLLLVG